LPGTFAQGVGAATPLWLFRALFLSGEVTRMGRNVDTLFYVFFKHL
jgi:hypothetical protein